MPVIVLFFTILVVGVFGFSTMFIFNLSRRLSKLERKQEYLELKEIDKLIASD